MVVCEHLCILFDKNKMVDIEEPFFGLLLVTPLEQWGVDKLDLVQVTLRYLKVILPIFNQILVAIWQVIAHMHTHTQRYKYIYI